MYNKNTFKVFNLNIYKTVLEIGYPVHPYQVNAAQAKPNVLSQRQLSAGLFSYRWMENVTSESVNSNYFWFIGEYFIRTAVSVYHFVNNSIGASKAHWRLTFV